MHTITYTFTPLDEPLHGRFIHALGLHGLLFNITGQADRTESDWLHKHPTPRPFTMVPLYTDAGILAGLRLMAIDDRSATLFRRTGEWFRDEKRPCHLGGREFVIDEVRCVPGPGWQQLAMSRPGEQVGLRFLSPTSFRQGPGHLPLPLPGNVFNGPARMWETYAPPLMTQLDGWREWCARDVFVVQHRIETVTVDIGKRERFSGFVGEVWFRAHGGSDVQLSIWQALTDLAAFSGIGHKTTMGMGVVERL